MCSNIKINFNIKKYFSENPTKMFASDINLSYTVT